MANELNFAGLKKLNVRDYWPDEAKDFTVWLEKSLNSEEPSELEEALNIDLEVQQREMKVGNYKLDLLAKEIEGNRKIVIENQLGSSDHNHLGKLIAYTAGVGADVIVWIASEFNDEHQDALQWLNTHTDEQIDFFCIEVEVWQIGNSQPAVRFNPIEEPSEWTKKARQGPEELTETKELQRDFWTKLRDQIKDSSSPLRPRKPLPQTWYNNPIGRRGVTLQFVFNSRDKKLVCGLLIRDSQRAFDKLKKERDAIERELNDELIWKPPEETKAETRERCKIIKVTDADLYNESKWDDYLDWLISNGEKFHEVFHPKVQDLKF